MTLTKKQMLCVGLGVFVALVIISSTKRVKLKEVNEEKKTSFDASSLPSALKPPTRLSDSEGIPNNATPRKSMALNLIGIKPRFDL